MGSNYLGYARFEDIFGDKYWHIFALDVRAVGRVPGISLSIHVFNSIGVGAVLCAVRAACR